MLGWFRRHATILMVVLGSAAMVIFGLGSVFNSIANSAGEKARENPTVAEWSQGKLTQDDIGVVYQRHAESMRFLGAVVEAAEEKSGDQVVSLADGISPITGTEKAQMSAVLSRIMLAAAAEEQGFIVDDGMVKEYIALISGDAQFSNADLERINRKVNQTSLDIVKKHIQTELLAMQMDRLSSVGLNLPPNPTEAISLYGRTAERIECEVIAVPVKDFVSKVTATPPDNELRELYKEGKNSLPNRFNDKPGFKVGRKINVQYFVAKAETFLQKEINGITDVQVQKEYDRLVAANDPLVMEPIVKDNSFVRPNLEGMLNGGSNSDGAPSPPGDDAPAPPSGDEDAPAPPSDAPAAPSDDAPAVPSDGAPAGGTTPAVETPATDAPQVELPNVEVEVPKPEVPKIEVPVVPENSLYSVRETQAQFVSTQDPVLNPADVQETPADVQKPEAVSTPPNMQAVEPAASDQADNQPPAADTNSVELPQADLPQADPPQAGGIGSDLDEELKKQEAAPERKHKPLIDVADSIRRSLASPIANVKMSSAIKEARFEIDDYFSELEIWESEDSAGTRPPVPDLEAIAKKYSLQLKQTGLVNQEEMKLDPLGSIQDRDGALGDKIFYWARDLKLFEATLAAPAFQPDFFAFWITENEEPHVAEFANCKEEVVEFWKKQQALELAKKEADSIRDKVNDDRKSKMSELYPDRALPTGQFSWFDTMRGGFSTPGNVEKPSDEFMKTAFSLVKLEAGVAPDLNRDTVYVIQSISGNRPVEEIGADYLQNQFMKFKRIPSDVGGPAYYYNRQEQGKAAEELQKELGFEYEAGFSN